MTAACARGDGLYRSCGGEPARQLRRLCQTLGESRLVLFTTKTTQSAYAFAYHADDVLLFGKESAGVTAEVLAAAHERVRLPMRAEVRSLNLATSAALALGEALRQTGGLPG